VCKKYFLFTSIFKGMGVFIHGRGEGMAKREGRFCIEVPFINRRGGDLEMGMD
jgi:hypothetical protein